MSNKIEDIFHVHYSPLCNFATKIISDSMAGEDIVQGLFIQLLENNKLQSVEHHERYLLRAVKFKCLDYLKHQKRKIEVSGHNSELELSTNNSEMSESDIEALFHYFAAKLPPKTREVFLLSRKSKLTYQEIASETGVSKKTVENQIGRALKSIREFLKEYDLFSK